MLSLASCRTTSPCSVLSDRQYRIRDSAALQGNEALSLLLKPYSDSLNGIMNRVLAVSEGVLRKALPEGSLGNFCADACMRQAQLRCDSLKWTRPDLCILNHGGLRAPLPEGNITCGNVFELMPFENELVLVELDSSQLSNVIQWAARKKGAPVSGIRFLISAEKAQDIVIGGQAINGTRKYIILTSDFLATGGDGYPVNSNPYMIRTGIKVRDALIKDLEALNATGIKLKPFTDGRIREIQP